MNARIHNQRRSLSFSPDGGREILLASSQTSLILKFPLKSSRFLVPYYQLKFVTVPSWILPTSWPTRIVEGLFVVSAIMSCIASPATGF